MGLLTPVIKGVLTDQGFANAVMAQQVYGGHGYIASTAWTSSCAMPASP